jgi:hypothetical protein
LRQVLEAEKEQVRPTHEAKTARDLNDPKLKEATEV